MIDYARREPSASIGTRVAFGFGIGLVLMGAVCVAGPAGPVATRDDITVYEQVAGRPEMLPRLATAIIAAVVERRNEAANIANAMKQLAQDARMTIETILDVSRNAEETRRAGGRV